MEKDVFNELRDGKSYHILDPDYVAQVHSEMKRCRHLCWKISQTDPDEHEAIVKLEEELLGPLKSGTFLTPPFVMMGPEVGLFTVNHDPAGIPAKVIKTLLP